MAALKKVLLAYDGSAGAKLALEDLKRNRAGFPSRAEVLVLCVADTWSSTAPPGLFGELMDAPVVDLRRLQAAEAQALKTARALALEAREALARDQAGWEVRAEACAASPAWGIIRRAEEWKPDVIVLGSHGRSPAGRMFLGSVSQAVVREAPCSVRVVRGRLGPRQASACLVIGFDGSPDAEAAIQSVIERVWPAGSAVRLVTALEQAISATIPSTRVTKARQPGASTWMRRMIADPAEQLRAAGLLVSSVVKWGDARRVLVQEARRWKADGIVVGARGLRGIKRFLLGSVSTGVAMHAPCSVEIIRGEGSSIMAQSIVARSGPSKKQRVRRRPVTVLARSRAHTTGPRQPGMEWRRKLQSLAIRRTRREVRRDRSGAPMRRQG